MREEEETTEYFKIMYHKLVAEVAELVEEGEDVEGEDEERERRDHQEREDVERGDEGREEGGERQRPLEQRDQ